MKQLFVFLLGTGLCAALIFAVLIFGRGTDGVSGRPILPEHYERVQGDAAWTKNVRAPVLPDLSPYTMAAARAKIPSSFGPESVESGTNGPAVRVQPLEKSYEYRKVKLQRLIPMYGELQQRFTPLAIELLAGDYNPETLLRAVNDTAYLDKTSAGYVVKIPILIGPKASLTLDGPENALRLASDRGVFLSNFGRLYIVESGVEGWDLETERPALFKDHESFRPHIVTWCGSEMVLAGSRFAHLGYFASKGYGISYTSCFAPVYEVFPDLPRPRGWVVGNHFEDIYYGFYSYEADGIVIIRNVYKDNVIYGIDPHDRSRRLIIAHNEVFGTRQKHGIIISREVDDSYIFHNKSHDNHGSGMMIDRDSTHTVIAYNELLNNNGDGLTFYESGHNLSYGNIMTGNKGSGLRIRNSAGIVSRQDVIGGNQGVGIQLYTADLTEGGKSRDLEMDPYEQISSLDIGSAELTGNRLADFKFENAFEIHLSDMRLFRSPEKIFAGDFRRSDLHLDPSFRGIGGKGLVLKQKQSLSHHP